VNKMVKKAKYIICMIRALCPDCGGSVVNWKGERDIDIYDGARTRKFREKYECGKCGKEVELPESVYRNF
jgi:endogenous inhibitor of DNA gyrase (YacG/DUF329 family)